MEVGAKVVVLRNGGQTEAGGHRYLIGLRAPLHPWPVRRWPGPHQLQADAADRVRIHIGILPRSGLADLAPRAGLMYVIAELFPCRAGPPQIVDQHPDVLHAFPMVLV